MVMSSSRASARNRKMATKSVDEVDTMVGGFTVTTPKQGNTVFNQQTVQSFTVRNFTHYCQ